MPTRNRRDFLTLTAAAAALPSVTAAQPRATGAELYRLVEAYTALGDHRSGTAVDRRTIEWFARELRRRGGETIIKPFSFDRYDWRSTVRIDGRRVPSLPLFYEGVGKVVTDRPYVAALAVKEADRTSAAVGEMSATAKARGEQIAVVASLNPLGEIQVPNRWPRIESGLPVILVPGREAGALKSGKVSVSFEAAIRPGESANVEARFGGGGGRPIVLATPLSGWFGCAAERGTGIAITIALAERLSRRGHPVVAVGASGHEILRHIGLEAYLKAHGLDPSLVVHLGANVALGVKDPATGLVRLAPGAIAGGEVPDAYRTVNVRMDPVRFDRLRPALAKAGLIGRLNPPAFLGEGALWSEAVAAPLMSFVGNGPEFHTPVDLPERTTSPQALDQAFQAIAEAIETFAAQ